MSEALFRQFVVPVANPDDARATTAALTPYVEAGGSTIIAVFVVEKSGGAPDKAPVEQMEQYANEIFAIVTQALADTDATVETQILYGTDVAATIIDAAHESDANAIVFTPRGGSRWVKLLTGNVTKGLLSRADLPVIVLPDPDD